MPMALAHHRLSKPKTNTNSPTGVKENSDTSISTLASFSDIDSPVVQSPAGDLRTRQDARQQLRSQLFGFGMVDSSIQPADEEDSVLQSAYNARDRNSTLSRTTSFVSAVSNQQTIGSNYNASTSNVALNRLSIVQEAPTLDLETAISLLQELRKNASPEELVALRKTCSCYCGLKMSANSFLRPCFATD